MVALLKGRDLLAHFDLKRTECSEIAELATRMLDEVPLYWRVSALAPKPALACNIYRTGRVTSTDLGT